MKHDSVMFFLVNCVLIACRPQTSERAGSRGNRRGPDAHRRGRGCLSLVVCPPHWPRLVGVPGGSTDLRVPHWLRRRPPQTWRCNQAACPWEMSLHFPRARMQGFIFAPCILRATGGGWVVSRSCARARAQARCGGVRWRWRWRASRSCARACARAWCCGMRSRAPSRCREEWPPLPALADAAHCLPLLTALSLNSLSRCFSCPVQSCYCSPFAVGDLLPRPDRCKARLRLSLPPVSPLVPRSETYGRILPL
eukprot:gene7792-biopygen4586